MTPQQKLQAKLAQAGIPAKEIKVYGSQIMVKTWSLSAANRWADLLSKFASRVRKPVESIDYTKDARSFFKANPGIVKSVVTHRVWLVGASI
jgi:hypothetical protein